MRIQNRQAFSVRFVVVPLLLLTAWGCTTSESTPELVATPVEVSEAYTHLLEDLDADRPGATVARLKEFADTHARYLLIREIRREIDRVKDSADGRYDEARELAREGEFENAEAILQDLASHLSDTRDGRSAAQHLEFDFYNGKAQWLMVRQQWEEVGEVARTLKAKELTRSQREQVESLLDNVGHVSAARSQATRTQAQIACRNVLMYLEMFHAEEGVYPPTLTLEDVEAWDPAGSRSILRHLAAIEDYEPTKRGVSFTAVSAEGQHRIRIVDGMVEG